MLVASRADVLSTRQLRMLNNVTSDVQSSHIITLVHSACQHAADTSRDVTSLKTYNIGSVATRPA